MLLLGRIHVTVTVIYSSSLSSHVYRLNFGRKARKSHSSKRALAAALAAQNEVGRAVGADGEGSSSSEVAVEALGVQNEVGRHEGKARIE